MMPQRYMRFQKIGKNIVVSVLECEKEIGSFKLDIDNPIESKKAEELGVLMKYAHYAYQSTKLH